MVQHFFRRTEKKYILTHAEYLRIIPLLESNMIRDSHYMTDIFNMYFDTPDNELIIESLEKPDYKYKIRARSYGDASRNKIYFEIKSKLDGVVYKRRAELTESEYETYLRNGQHEPGQVMSELDYIFTQKNLLPKIFIAYRRISYAANDESDLRVTIDSDLRSRTTDLDLDYHLGCSRYFDAPTYILEVKSRGGMPKWLVENLSAQSHYPNSFSKYGRIYQKLQAKELAYA